MKKSFLWLLYALGVTRFAAWWHRREVVILNYHEITKTYPPLSPNSLDLRVTLDNFASQISYLRRRYKIISLREFIAATQERRRLPDYSAILTFDDGYRSAFATATLLLIKYSLPATFFLITGMMREENAAAESAQENQDTYLSWAEAQDLSHHQFFDFGSHTCSHPSLTEIAPEELERELCDSFSELLRRLKNVVPALAYPNGAYSTSFIEKVQSAGYACALTIDSGPNGARTNPYLLRRQTIRGSDDIFVFAARLSCLTWWLHNCSIGIQFIPKWLKSILRPSRLSFPNGEVSPTSNQQSDALP